MGSTSPRFKDTPPPPYTPLHVHTRQRTRARGRAPIYAEWGREGHFYTVLGMPNSLG